MAVQKTNWAKCCICQQDTKEKLIQPSLFNREQDRAGYGNIARNVPLFYEINALPILLNPTRLDDGDGIESTLTKNRAKYHQSCKLLFNNTKLERAQKRASSTAADDTEEEIRVKRPRTPQPSQAVCFICERGSPTTALREAMTMKVNDRLNECAKNLSDEKLLAKLSAGDAVAQEFKYHPACLVGLYNRERALLNTLKYDQNPESSANQNLYPFAFSELVIYIMDMKTASDGTDTVIFKLADLVSLYKQRLQQLGVESPYVNSTRLKEQLLSRIPELEAHKTGRDVLIAFKKDVSSVLSDASKYNEAIHLAKAANIIRKEMLNHKTKFDNEFHEGFVEESIPPTLLQFICNIEHGVDIKSHLNHGVFKSDIAIAQLLQYNCYNKCTYGAATHRHSKDRETPFAVYIGMTVFAKTRKRQLIDMLHENGISISYDRVLEVSALLGESVVNQYVADGVVCPPILRKGLFTTSAMDNIDHNPTATTANTSFHGTSISMFQHPSPDNEGEIRPPLQLSDNRAKKIPEIPESFTNIRPAFFNKKNPEPRPITNIPLQDPTVFSRNFAPEYDWLETVSLTQEVNDSASITWSAHHASQRRSQGFDVSITSLFPLLRDQAHSVATIRHVMDKVRDTLSFLNPGQTPVITADQPLYALAKQIQWHWPEHYGEDKFVIMFGGLHIEMTALKSIGTLLKDSGWTSALVEAGVASPGTADSFLSASSVTRTRLSHQITVCSLYELMKDAYNAYMEETPDNTTISFESWSTEQKRPQFKFWFLIYRMELTILILIRSFREANFRLYREALFELIPYFFADNNVNYARWLPIHLRDMMYIEEQHPEVAREFHKGNFVVHKSARDFSAVAIDQAHEQNNAVIKGDGGAVGLTEDPSALRRWMVAGPEVSRLVANYEAVSGAKDVKKSNRHHEQTEAAQK